MLSLRNSPRGNGSICLTTDASPQTAAAAPFRVPQKKSNQPLIWGAIAAVAAIVIGSGVALMRPTAKPASTIVAATAPASQTMAPTLQQTAAQGPPSVPSVIPSVPSAAGPALTPEPVPVPVPVPATAPQVAEAPPVPPPVAQPNPEATAWQTADAANTPEVFAVYQLFRQASMRKKRSFGSRT
jgi:hypothetical protein